MQQVAVQRLTLPALGHHSIWALAAVVQRCDAAAAWCGWLHAGHAGHADHDDLQRKTCRLCLTGSLHHLLSPTTHPT